MRKIRAVGALLVLLVLLAGVPAALAATIGNPMSALPDLLAGDVSDAALIGVLAAVAWVAWVQFALATVVELAAAARRIPMPRRIPGVLSGQQHLARSLVMAAFMLGPVTATALLSPAAFTTLPPTTPVSLSASPSAGHTPDAAAETAGQPAGQASVETAGTIVYTIPSGPGPATLWDIAQAHLGAGERWQEIWQLNEGRPQPNGAVMSSPRRLLPGWTVLVPSSTGAAAATGTGTVEVTVQPGDTLSELAREHGQSGWQPAWQVNAGRTQPDGGVYTDPDLIRPGWQLSIPAATSPEVAPVAPAPTAGDSTETAQDPDSSADVTPQTGAVAEEPAVSGTAPVAPAVPRLEPVPAPVVPEQPPAAPQSEAEARPEVRAPAVADSPVRVGEVNSTSGTSTVVGVAAFAGGGVLLAAVSLAALRRLRRRRFRDRTLGLTISSTPTELAPMEKALLTRGPHGTADVTWLNTVLRSLAQSVTAGPGEAQLPDVVAVRMTPEVLELVLTAAHAGSVPEPWRVDETGLRWSVRRDDDLGLYAEDALEQFSPYPTLATVGHTGTGEHWLVDLERVGAMSLTGDRQRCLDLARFLAAELAHNSWSEQLQVSLVGFGAELAELNPSRVTHRADVNDAVVALQAALRDTTTVLDQSGTEVLASRVSEDGPGDGWAPHVLLVAPATGDEPDADGLRTLLDAMRAQRSRAAVALVLTADETFESQTRWQLHVDAAGQLTIPALGVQLTAQQLPATEAADLAALLSLTAAGPDVAMPAARGDQPWDAYADAAGAPLADLVEGRLEQQPPELPAAERWWATRVGSGADRPAAASSVLPLATPEYLAATATTAQDVVTLAPAVSAQVREQVESADPTLDEDLAAWHDPDSGIAKLTLLGPVLLSAHGNPPSPARPEFYAEIVTYLASHPSGVTGQQLKAAFWPDQESVPAARVRTAISSTRLWLGQHPVSKAKYLPEADGRSSVGVYRLQGLLVDAELFRRLRLRGVARGSDGVADLQAALDLVSGVPLDADRRRDGGWAWLVDTPLEHEYTAMIVDVAHLVATHYLAAGSAELADQAAQAALRTGARDDVALLDLVAAHDALGNQAEADRYVAQILSNHAAEVEEDLPPRTYEVLRRRRWLPQDARVS